MHPEIRPGTIGGPVSFVRVNGAVTAAELFRNVIDDGLSAVRQHRFKADQSGGRERNPKHLLDDLRNFSVADSNIIA